MSQSLRWGIIGVSEIAHDFCVALNLKFTRSEHEIVAVTSIDSPKGLTEQFARDHNIPKVWSDYHSLASDDQVEVAYISILNPLRYELCKMMIEYNKHIVCERPFCMNSRQMKEVLELAKKKGVFVMEGLWSRFFPVYRYLRELMNLTILNNVKEVYVKHGYNATSKERIVNKDCGGGVVLDIGIDAIQFVIFIYQEQPKSIKASGKINSVGVDLYVEVEMVFSGDRKATIICSGLQVFENQATVISKKGPICIPDYNCPTQLFGCNGAHEWSLISSTIPMNFRNSLGLRYEADEVMKCIRSGKLECEIVPAKEMLIITQICDEIRKQIGVRYDK
ncbi:trans-1,2-dihydrobenzene-1,2-diol dehydrogenase-like [Eupeodes corollae]|uniref:trans-1,2-dihydrobenzene-1,2-diol dehydrogenase-like n=1 Tax=Eupeodes corollae TaxID=290404 RepID=UPI00249329FC|nr:trans-1,2-dihydrobenzene-1,2-diol dehydrogenase-like [Eupeodes corollae]